jgi:hypothetical protein
MFDSTLSNDPEPLDHRPVTPRRPLRLAPREQVAEARTGLAALNIFTDAFDPDEVVAEPETGNLRRARGRMRMRALLQAADQHLVPEQINLWHDAFAVDPTPPQPIASPAEPDATPPVPCQLQHRLHAVRAALYPAQDDVAATPSLPLRLAAHVMNLILMAVFLPLGAMLFLIGLLRGPDLHLSARSIAVTGILTGMLDLGLGRMVGL